VELSLVAGCQQAVEILTIALLGCNAVQTCRWISTFWRNVLPPSSRRYNPEDQLQHTDLLITLDPGGMAFDVPNITNEVNSSIVYFSSS
jgi:hypothetical protein